MVDHACFEAGDCDVSGFMAKVGFMAKGFLQDFTARCVRYGKVYAAFDNAVMEEFADFSTEGASAEEGCLMVSSGGRAPELTMAALPKHHIHLLIIV